MDPDPEMMESAARAYLDSKAGRYVSEQEINDMLKDDWIRNYIISPMKGGSKPTVSTQLNYNHLIPRNERHKNPLKKFEDLALHL